MRTNIIVSAWILALASAVWAAAPKSPGANSMIPIAQAPAQAESMRVEGEKRFRANCGRCHAAPQKFPPRMMATIVRHMRVRATITDQDMQLVLFYMTQ